MWLHIIYIESIAKCVSTNVVVHIHGSQLEGEEALDIKGHMALC